ncbi:hypothetical protein MNBD_ALPHA06-1773, partial [hydrothermal vent metagenome]
MSSSHAAFAATAEFAVGCCVLAGAGAGLVGGLAVAGAAAQIMACLDDKEKTVSLQKITKTAANTGRYFLNHTFNAQDVPDKTALLDHINTQINTVRPEAKYFLNGHNNPDSMAKLVLDELTAPAIGIAKTEAFTEVTLLILKKTFELILLDREFYTNLKPKIDGKILAQLDGINQKLDHNTQQLDEIKAAIAQLSQGQSSTAQQQFSSPQLIEQMAKALLEDAEEAHLARADIDKAVATNNPEMREKLVQTALNHLRDLRRRHDQEANDLRQASQEKTALAAKTARGEGAARLMFDTLGALEAWQSASKHEPEHFETRIQLARLLARVGQSEQALA